MDMSTRPGDEDSRPDGFEPDDETAAGEDPDEPGWGDGIFGRADPRLLLERIYWPTLAIGGLFLFALCYAPWGRGAEGVQPQVTGLGRIEISGAAPEDQPVITSLESEAVAAALPALVLAALIVVVALLAWWQPRLRLAGFAVVLLAAIGAIVNAALVAASPSAALFSDRVNTELGEVPMGVAYGVIGALVCAAVIAVVALAGLVGRLRLGPVGSR